MTNFDFKQYRAKHIFEKYQKMRIIFRFFLMFLIFILLPFANNDKKGLVV